VYVGSALGTGGLKRMRRHIFHSGNRGNYPVKKPHWHIDYLLLSPFFKFEGAIYVESEDQIECVVAGKFGQGIKGFGCSECSCSSHLFFRERCPVEEIKTLLKDIGYTALTFDKSG
jgi:Uri superfamily endonuclease